MRLLFKAFHFYINASIHVAFAVCALVGVTIIEFHLEVSSAFSAFVFFGTITGYNFVKFAEVAGISHKSLVEALRSIQIFSLFCFVMALYFGLQFSDKTIAVTLIFALLTFFYVVPLLKRKNLRTFGGLKIFIVGLVWAGVTVIVPVIASELPLTTASWISFLQRFLLVVALTLPFEIRDLGYDVLELKTLPQQFGLRKSKVLGLLLLLVCIILEGFKGQFSWSHFTSLAITSTLIAAFLLISKKHQSKYFASFWVESIPIFWWGVFLGFSELF
jgi:hypothetical protein